MKDSDRIAVIVHHAGEMAVALCEIAGRIPRDAPLGARIDASEMVKKLGEAALAGQFAVASLRDYEGRDCE
jgi:hypothetical protein